MKKGRPVRSEARRQAPPETGMYSSGSAPDRASAIVWCQRRDCEAVVSTVRRDVGATVLRYVQWCSLVGIDVTCDERCVFSFAEEGGPQAAPDDRATPE